VANNRSVHEIEVLSEFLFVYSGAPGPLPQPRNPPEPDLFCASGPFAGSFFELGRILDPESPRLHIEAIRRSPQGVKPDPSKFGWPERDMLLQKLGKTYETGGHPVHLLLYWEWSGSDQLTANAPPPFKAPYCVTGADLLLPIVRSTKHPFSGIFYFDRYTTRIMWLCRGAV